MKNISWLIVLFFISTSWGQQNAINRKQDFNLSKNNLAISGYDPVSYFTGNPKEGKSTIAFTYNGVSYRFINSKNLELFKSSPSKYEPMYGGWCAYAMGATGEKVEVDPETFKIINGKLFLFYNAFFNNTLTKWNDNEKYLNKKADDNWSKIIK